MLFEIRNREITGDEEFLVGDNADYTAKFTFDKEWDGVTKTARFIKGNEYKDVLLVDDQCLVPVELLKNGYLVVGVYSSAMTTTRHRVLVKSSIKEESGNPATPTPNIYEQLIKRLDELLKQVIVNLDYDEDPITGLVKYKADTGTYETILLDDEVTSESENITTSKAIYEFVKGCLNEEKDLLVYEKTIYKTKEEWDNFKKGVETQTFQISNFSKKPKKGDYAIAYGKVSENNNHVLCIFEIYSIWNVQVYVTCKGIVYQPIVPTKTSELTNDSGFITADDMPDIDVEETDPTVPIHVKTITQDDIIKWNNDVTQTQLNDAVKAVAGQNEYIGSYTNVEYTAETIQTELSNFVAAQTNPSREKRNGDIINIVNGIYGGQQWIYSSNEAVWKYYIDFDNHSVIDNLTSDSSIDGLSARQGKLLKEHIEANYMKKDVITLTLKDNGAYTLTIQK